MLLFDHLVGAGEQRRRNIEAERALAAVTPPRPRTAARYLPQPPRGLRVRCLEARRPWSKKYTHGYRSAAAAQQGID
jgi:hypothetical protein